MKFHFSVFLCYSIMHIESNLLDDQQAILPLQISHTVPSQISHTIEPYRIRNTTEAFQISNTTTTEAFLNETHNFLPTPPLPPAKEYYQQRRAEIENLILKNISNPYPHTFFVDQQSDIFFHDDGMFEENVTVSLAGRIMAITLKNLTTLYEVMTDIGLVQIGTMTSDKNPILQRGDIVGASGHPGTTPKGIYYLFVTKLTLLAPCLHKLPTKIEGNTRYTNRYLDLILDDKSMVRFKTRAKIISLIRSELNSKDFLEVETPLLNKIPGGATASSFRTHFDSTNRDLYLRTAPELFHKILVIGGMNKIYEIGKVFKNEEIDSTHNPEVTSLELYMAYADYNDMMSFTESLLLNVVMELFGGYKVTFQPEGSESRVVLDFTPPFARKPMIPTLETVLNVTFPPPDKLLDSPQGLKFLQNLVDKHGIHPQPPLTSIRMLQSLVKNFIANDIVSPTFITEFPRVESPLAKQHRILPGLSERFKLYVLKKEVGNGYTENNDPFAQRILFAQQDRQRVAGDNEIPPTDEEFITAMEYGLPPTAGVGLGIDRLVMILTNSTVIQDVILFPATDSVEPLTTTTTPTQDSTEND